MRRQPQESAASMNGHIIHPVFIKYQVVSNAKSQDIPLYIENMYRQAQNQSQPHSLSCFEVIHPKNTVMTSIVSMVKLFTPAECTMHFGGPLVPDE